MAGGIGDADRAVIVNPNQSAYVVGPSPIYGVASIHIAGGVAPADCASFLDLPHQPADFRGIVPNRYAAGCVGVVDGAIVRPRQSALPARYSSSHIARGVAVADCGCVVVQPHQPAGVHGIVPNRYAAGRVDLVKRAIINPHEPADIIASPRLTHIARGVAIADRSVVGPCKAADYLATVPNCYAAGCVDVADITIVFPHQPADTRTPCRTSHVTRGMAVADRAAALPNQSADVLSPAHVAGGVAVVDALALTKPRQPADVHGSGICSHVSRGVAMADGAVILHAPNQSTDVSATTFGAKTAHISSGMAIADQASAVSSQSTNAVDTLHIAGGPATADCAGVVQSDQAADVIEAANAA